MVHASRVADTTKTCSASAHLQAQGGTRPSYVPGEHHQAAPVAAGLAQHTATAHPGAQHLTIGSSSSSHTRTRPPAASSRRPTAQGQGHPGGDGRAGGPSSEHCNNCSGWLAPTAPGRTACLRSRRTGQHQCPPNLQELKAHGECRWAGEHARHGRSVSCRQVA